MISPEMWDNEGFNKLSHWARLLWIGLISNADDLGRGIADCQSLKNKVFPFDKISLKRIEKWRFEIQNTMRNIQFYPKKTKRYYQLIKWEEYQYVRKDRTRVSKIQPPKGYQTTTIRQPNDGIEENRTDKNRIDKMVDTSLNKFNKDKLKEMKEGKFKGFPK